MTQELQTLIDELLAEAREERVDTMAAMAEIVDIPLRREEAGGAACDYVMASGEICGRAAFPPTPGEDGAHAYCQMHADWMSLGIAQWGIPFPEDAVSLQQFLVAVVDRMVNGKVSYGRDKAVVELCKLIAKNVRGVEWERRR